MKRYYRKEETPLSFHKFFWYFSLPAGFISGIVTMISKITEMQFFNWQYAADIGYRIINLFLYLICFIGFFRWKPYAWYGVMTSLCLGHVYSLLTIITQNYPNIILFAICFILVELLYVIPVGIYYLKRRSLFFQDFVQVISENGNDVVNE